MRPSQNHCGPLRVLWISERCNRRKCLFWKNEWDIFVWGVEGRVVEEVTAIDAVMLECYLVSVAAVAYTAFYSWATDDDVSPGSHPFF